MVYTPIANIPQIVENQIAHITHNEAIVSLEALSIGVVISRSLASPPSNPNEGDIYIPASGSTGAWATQDNNLAQWFNSQWIFYQPINYSPKWSIADGGFIYFDGSVWSLSNTGVLSVNGDTGVVLLDTDDIDEGSVNLYYTDARVATYLGTVANIANGYARLDGSGKLLTSILPAIAITDIFVINNQSAMLALTAEIGDVAVRTDLNKSFILKAFPASTLSNWQELLTPTDTILSVNGQTGIVVLNTDDIVAGSTNKYARTIAYNTTDYVHRAKLTFLGDGVNLADDSGGDRTTVTINRGVPFVQYDSTQTSSFSLSSLHHGLTIPCTGSFTITLPQLTSNVQTTIVNSNTSTGTITFAAGSGVSIEAKALTLSTAKAAVWAGFDAATNKWYLVGDLS